MFKFTRVIQKAIFHTSRHLGSGKIFTKLPTVSTLSKCVPFKRSAPQSMKFNRIQYGFSEHKPSMKLSEILQRIDFQNNQSKEFFIQAIDQVLLGNIDDGLLLMRRSFELEPTKYLILYEIAQMIANLHPETSRELLEEILKLDENNTYALYGLFPYYRDIGNYEAAMEIANKYLTIKPEDAFMTASKMTIVAHLGNHQEVINKESQAIRLDPNNVLAYVSRGILYHEMNFHKQAIEDIQTALAIELQKEEKSQPLIHLCLVKLANSYAFLDFLEKSLQIIQGIVSRFEDSSHLCLLRGTIYMKMDRFQEALGELQKCATNALSVSDLLQAFYYRGICKLILGRLEEAVQQFNVAIQHEESPEKISIIFDYRGLAYQKMGLPEFVQKNSLERQEWINNHQKQNNNI